MKKDRFNFLGIHVSRINLKEAISQISTLPFNEPGYISFPDASVANEASKDPFLRGIINNARFTMPDGKPSEIAARLQGLKKVRTVSGYHLCNALLQTPHTHYFYGADEETLQKMRSNIEKKYPEAKILGYKSPPFAEKNTIAHNETIKKDIQTIENLAPDLVWIGISSPKQDYLMHYFHPHLSKSMMLGIGGVFLYLADESLKSPEWVKKAGLRWAYRLMKEPKRLRSKYFSTFRFLVMNTPFFIGCILKKHSVKKTST